MVTLNAKLVAVNLMVLHVSAIVTALVPDNFLPPVANRGLDDGGDRHMLLALRGLGRLLAKHPDLDVWERQKDSDGGNEDEEFSSSALNGFDPNYSDEDSSEISLFSTLVEQPRSEEEGPGVPPVSYNGMLPTYLKRWIKDMPSHVRRQELDDEAILTEDKRSYHLPNYIKREGLIPSYIKREPTIPSYIKPQSLPSYIKREASMPSYIKRDPSMPSYIKREPSMPSFTKRRSMPSYDKRQGQMPSYFKREQSMPSYIKREPSMPSYIKRESAMPSYIKRQGMPSYIKRAGQIPSYIKREGSMPAYIKREGSMPAYIKRADQIPSYIRR